MSTLLTISRFSQLTGLTAKALRFYDETQLLRPALVDERTGYRSYSDSQREDARRILLLRQLDLPLEDIRTLLRLHDPAALQARLDDLRSTFERQHRARLASLDQLQEIAGDAFPTRQVQVKRVPAQTYLGLRLSSPPGEVCAAVHAAVRRLRIQLRQLDIRPAGPQLAVYHSPDDQPVWEVEVGLPVPEHAVPCGRDGAYLAQFPAGVVASTVHAGPYEGANGLDPAYRTLNAWLADHGVAALGPLREQYLFHPENTADPDDYRVELVCPVGSNSSPLSVLQET